MQSPSGRKGRGWCWTRRGNGTCRYSYEVHAHSSLSRAASFALPPIPIPLSSPRSTGLAGITSWQAWHLLAPSLRIPRALDLTPSSSPFAANGPKKTLLALTHVLNPPPSPSLPDFNSLHACQPHNHSLVHSAPPVAPPKAERPFDPSTLRPFDPSTLPSPS